jgi:hypothetical protein
VFLQPQRLLVPLFQRPYVWNLDVQWQPLWEDVIRQADRVLARVAGGIKPHFLGAVVLQQAPIGLGGLQEWTVIDGQQRLTTLQILMDAVHAVVQEAGAEQAADRLVSVIRNGSSWVQEPSEQLKVWPTNRDRGAFYEVMTALPPVDYASLQHHGETLVNAHAFFTGAARDYLAADPRPRADALAVALLQGLQLVVIALDTEDDAQEIFETLNGRMTPLTAADLIKNLLFQRLAREGADTEALYRQYWEHFETPFWEKLIGRGRVLLPRVSMFLSDYLIAATGEEVRPADVFRSFKRFLESDPRAANATEWLIGMSKHSLIYQQQLQESMQQTGTLSEVAQFMYRIRALDTEVANPVLLWLLDPNLEPVPEDQLSLALRSLESWLFRRAIVGVTTKNYNRVLLELLRRLRAEPRTEAGTVVEDYLVGQRPITSYWPGDAEVREALTATPIYHRLAKLRLRVILEAVEDRRRHFGIDSPYQSEMPISRGNTTIEHIMPQEWQENWKPFEGDKEARDLALQAIGNLTLLTGKMNSAMSNKPWTEKRAALKKHSVLLLSERDVSNKDMWDEKQIALRGSTIADEVIQTWPIPSGAAGVPALLAPSAKISVATLVIAGALSPGQVLRGRGTEPYYATVLDNGRLEVNGVSYGSPSGAAKAANGRETNGWWWWLVDYDGKVSLSDVWNEYQAQGEDRQVPEDTDLSDEVD